LLVLVEASVKRNRNIQLFKSIITQTKLEMQVFFGFIYFLAVFRSQGVAFFFMAEIMRVVFSNKFEGTINEH